MVRFRHLAAAALATLALAALTATAGAGPGGHRSQQHSVIGESVRGRPIEVRRVGDPKADLKVLLVGSIHGDET